MTEIRPIRTEADYDAALKEIAPYFENEPEHGTPESDHFDILAALIGAYEEAHWRVDPPDDPVDAICAVMEMRQFTQRDLGMLLGSRSRASELLNRKRGLTMEQA